VVRVWLSTELIQSSNASIGPKTIAAMFAWSRARPTRIADDGASAYVPGAA
jgi:hypothetical protein